MDQVRTAVGLGSLEGKLYAVGGECEATGHEGTLYLKSVECFDPRTNSWSRIPDMQFPRSFAAVSSFNGKSVYNNLYKEFLMVSLLTNRAATNITVRILVFR